MKKLHNYDVKLYSGNPEDDELIVVHIAKAIDAHDASRRALLMYPDAISVWASRAPRDWFMVSVYICDKVYGGLEEGGWYYSTGTPVTDAMPLMRVFRDHDEASDYANRLQRALNVTWNIGRPSISSVLSEGEYRAIIDQNEMPAHYPTERPRYE